MLHKLEQQQSTLTLRHLASQSLSSYASRAGLQG